MTGKRRRGRVLLRGGPPRHPWVYRRRILGMDDTVADGDLVEVQTREGKPCGYGFAHRSSLIALRLLSHDPAVVPGPEWLVDRVRRADALRRGVLRLPEVTNAWRLLHGEGDGVSGLVVDRYPGVAVASLFSKGWDLRREEIVAALRSVAQVQQVVFRTDERTIRQEKIAESPVEPSPPIWMDEYGLKFLVDPGGRHKTGAFLDQRDNRQALARLAAGRRVLDLMTCTGGFALHALRAGAREATGVDLDEAALDLARRNARENALEVAFHHADAFEVLRTIGERPAAERPEVIVLDPPKWGKDRAALPAACQRYLDLNRLAFSALASGGLLMTHSCSGLVSETTFLDILSQAALLAQRPARILRIAGAAPDHPVAMEFPEGRYLKSVLLECP